MRDMARACVWELKLQAGARLAIDVEDAELGEAIGSLAAAAGAELAGADETDATAGLVDLAEPLGAHLPSRLRRLVSRVAPGGMVAVLLHAGTGGASVEAFSAAQRARFDLARAHGAWVGAGAALVAGARRERLSGAERKRLRGMGHALEPTVLVGRSGPTAELVEAARGAVERHGLLKVKLTPQCGSSVEEVAETLAWATGSQLVQRVGRTLLLFRPDVALAPPVFRRRGGRAAGAGGK